MKGCGIMAFYFYHLLSKEVTLKEEGLLSLQAQFDKGMEEANEKIEIYRERALWWLNLENKKKAEELTKEEIVTAIKNFRCDPDGLNRIYFFKHTPEYGMGKNMDSILDCKKIIRIDLDNLELKKSVKKVDWGRNKNHNEDYDLNEEYYRNIWWEAYFSNYTDNPPNGVPLFASVNHISLSMKNGNIPLKFLEEV
jgi:hypothetical protein